MARVRPYITVTSSTSSHSLANFRAFVTASLSTDDLDAASFQFSHHQHAKQRCISSTPPLCSSLSCSSTYTLSTQRRHVPFLAVASFFAVYPADIFAPMFYDLLLHSPPYTQRVCSCTIAAARRASAAERAECLLSSPVAQWA